MNVLARIASAATALLVLASVGTAQQLTAPATANVGQEITISYSNPDKANQTVGVQVLDDNGDQVALLEIQLNGNGDGSVQWTVLATPGFGFEFVADDAQSATAVLGS